jgi:hypothetical protein
MLQKLLETHGAGYVSLLKVCPHLKDSARAFSMVASAFMEGV